MGMGWYTKESYEVLKKKGWPKNHEAVVSLPDSCYMKQQRNNGSQYFKRSPEFY
jgi:hypothetical protein